jgi:hypothetical protein
MKEEKKMTSEYILSHTPREIAEENTTEEIYAAFKEISPIRLEALERIVFNTGYLAAVPPYDTVQSASNFKDAHGPNGEIMTASIMAQTMALYYAYDMRRIMAIW